MRAGQETKSSKQWTMRNEGILPLTNWNATLDQGGIVRFEDGTIWVLMTDRYSPADGYTWSGNYGQWKQAEHIDILEKREGRGWELLTGSNFARVDVDVTSGSLVSDMMAQYSSTAFGWVNDGVDTVYLHNGGRIFEINKDTRTWITHSVPSNMYAGGGNVFAVDDNYLWWWQTDNAGSYSYTISRLCRMSRKSPYGMEIYDSFNTESFIDSGGSRYDVGSDGIKEGMSTDKVFFNDSRVNAIYDGYIYMFEGDLGTLVDETYAGTYKPSPTNGYSGIRRYNIATKSMELLYYSVVMREFNKEINGVYDRDIDYGPFPTITGFKPLWAFRPYLRDGWLYYIDAAGETPYYRHGYIWYAGYVVRRISLDYLLRNKPVTHNAHEPIVETLSNGTSPGEGWGTYTYELDIDATFHRGGNKPLHSIPAGQSWYMDEDGSLVFVANEVSEYVTAYTDAAWPLMRLSPPSGDVMNIALVFEGNAMKGYAPVHGTPSKSCPEIVELA